MAQTIFGFALFLNQVKVQLLILGGDKLKQEQLVGADVQGCIKV